MKKTAKPYYKSLEIIHGFTQSIIKQKRKELQEQEEKGEVTKKKLKSFVEILLQTKDEDGNGLSDKEIQDHS